MCLRSYFQFVILWFFVRFSLNFLHLCRSKKMNRKKMNFEEKNYALRILFWNMAIGTENTIAGEQKKGTNDNAANNLCSFDFCSYEHFYASPCVISSSRTSRLSFHSNYFQFQCCSVRFGSVLFNENDAIFCAAQKKNMIPKFEQREINR